MYFTPCAWLLLSLSLQASGSPATPDVPAEFAYDLRLAPGEHLLRYAWDGGDAVPYLASGPNQDVHIVYGELGLRPGARLYLPANALDESAASGARTLLEQGLVPVAGRFGQALGFGASSVLRVALPPQAPEVSGWTLSFWLRPEPGAFGRTLVVLPGAVEVVLQGDGRVRARLLPNDAVVVHDSALPAGRWSFVLASYDPLLTRQLRLIVDGVGKNVTFSATAPARIASELIAGDVNRAGQGFVGALDELALVPLPLSTDEAQRAACRALEPGTHRLEMVTDRGLRTALLASSPVLDFVLDTPEEFALGHLEGAVVENASLRWAPGRWQLLETHGAPPPRTAHPTVALGAQRLLTFGGETRDTHLWPMRNTDDTWIYSGATDTWERVPTPVAPSPRCHLPAAYSPDHDLVLMVGGWRNDSVPDVNFDDTWVFHVSERRWERRFPGGDRLAPGSGYGLVYLPALRRFLLIRASENLLYDPVADVWQRLPAARAVTESGQPASYTPGISPISALDPATGLVVLFGGSRGQPVVFSDQTAFYDVASNTYTVLAPPVHPSERVRSGFAYDSRRGHFVLFGGVKDQYSIRNDDLWVFDPRARRWSELACSNRPSPRGGFYGMAYDEVADRFVLFGGRNSPQRWLDETWSLEVSGTRTGTALYTFDRLSDPGRRAWFADASTPGGSSIDFLFRTSDTGSDWSPWNPSSAHFGGRRYVQVVALLKPGPGGACPSIQRMGLR